MEVLNGKPYATLTDVKNLIGDVFAMADRHGEVVITSYNKPKYKLIRLSRDQISESMPTESEQVESAKPEPKPVVAEQIPVEEVIPVIAAPIEIEEETEPVVVEKVDGLETESVVEITEPTLEVPATTIPEVAKLEFDEWDRLSLNELNWVNLTRKLI